VITKPLLVKVGALCIKKEGAHFDTPSILEVIGTLPDLQQSILRMKHLEGFEVEEIARLTGSTPVAVRTNLSRARKRVKEQFMIHSKVWN
uniref:RNA polymerase sigma factor n=1 Tax=Phocaeicola vulgatus TaxID=821 RepID=UPI0032E43D72